LQPDQDFEQNSSIGGDQGHIHWYQDHS